MSLGPRVTGGKGPLGRHQTKPQLAREERKGVGMSVTEAATEDKMVTAQGTEVEGKNAAICQVAGIMGFICLGS